VADSPGTIAPSTRHDVVDNPIKMMITKFRRLLSAVREVFLKAIPATPFAPSGVTRGTKKVTESLHPSSVTMIEEAFYGSALKAGMVIRCCEVQAFNMTAPASSKAA
jgi:hypothetical protein